MLPSHLEETFDDSEHYQKKNASDTGKSLIKHIYCTINLHKKHIAVEIPILLGF